MGGEITAVELHPFNHLQGRLDAFALFRRDDPVSADLLHGLGDDLPYRLISIGRNRGHFADFLGIRNLSALFPQVGHNNFYGGVDAPLQVDGVRPGGHELNPFAVNGFGQDRRGGGSVSGVVGRFLGHLFDHLGAHVLEGVG